MYIRGQFHTQGGTGEILCLRPLRCMVYGCMAEVGCACCRQQFEDPMVLCSAEEMASLLKHWMQNLESLVVHLTSSSPYMPTSRTVNNGEHRLIRQNITDNPPGFEEISKAFLGYSYQSLSSIVKATVTELATLCAEMGVYSSEYVEVATSRREGEEMEDRDKKEQVTADPDTRYV